MTTADARSREAAPPAPMVDAWLSSVRSANTRRAYRQDLREWTAWLHDRDAEPLTANRSHVEAWTASLERDGRAPATRTRKLSSIGSFYTYAIDEGRRFGLTVTRDPTARAHRPYVDRAAGADHRLSVDDARAVLRAADAAGPRAAVIVRLILQAGCGVRDITGARVEDLERPDRPRPGRGRAAPGCVPAGRRHTLSVTRRGGVRHRVALPAGAARAIVRTVGARTRGPVVTTRNGRRVADSQVFRTVRLTGHAAGVEVTPRALRDACANLALEAGVPLRDVQCLLGHADPRSEGDPWHSCETAPYAIAAFLGL
ncbi:tyrosine-type recombinase/integrase [Actinoallomurus iriomotensis]|uniref:Tyrosine recombinase XerC n=1 Tax=Actinoallomurus iriomotensis TaxID=478107 RepID=A0A9W6RHL9_9ACTN|nr:site-specific integrase [Actinoallomurus iriomotensis]GLY74202.1 tyrosine recombinase XerC [Actinoallomurus iriomotensis]